MFYQILILLIIATPFKMVFLKNKLPNCTQNTLQLINLFNLMCNNLANLEINTLRDACLGCFRSATTINNNQPSLTDLNNCAELYLIDTRYESCINQIDNSTPNPPKGQCVTGYCNFVTCIRRINADLLISECYSQASENNDAILETEQVLLVKNAVSCILARSRCATINPITGQQQSNVFTQTTFDKWGKPKIAYIPLYNSLQITPGGDLRVIALPGTTKIQNYFCTAQPNLQESNWMEFSC